DMYGLDTLIAKSFENTIKDNLGQKTFEKIEQRIFEKHGIPLSQAIQDFKKFDSVLKEFFGSGAIGIEKQILDKIIIMKEIKNKEKNWITIEDPRLTKLLLESFGDEDKKNIINSVIDEPRIISDILELSNIPQTSGYRKVNTLIQNGMLIPHGSAFTHGDKKGTKYKSVFENISIEIEKNRITVRVLPTNESFAKSTVMQLVCL
ncbi:MAG: transcriptional regulator, partial [Nitrosopumilaceae archaeon]